MTTGTLADGTGLLHAILAHPEDDAPRLVYADWLEERGQYERAELIRLQVKMHRAPLKHHNRDMTYREFEKLQRRERELLCHNFDKWHGLPNDPHGRVWDMQNFDDDDPEPEAQFRALFRRGFVDEVSMRLEAWRQWGPQLVQRVPLTRVRISDRDPLHHSNSVSPFAWWVDLGIDPADDDKSDLPRDIFELLTGGYLVPSGVGRRTPRREYDTLADAHDDLSAACLLFAKRKDSPQ